MRGALRDFDEYLLDRVFERFSLWTDRIFGFNCFFWARVFLIIDFAAFIAMLIIYPALWQEGFWRTTVQTLSLFIIPICLMAAPEGLKKIGRLEKDLLQMGNERLVNHNRVKLQAKRIGGIFRTVLIFLLLNWFGVARQGLLLVGFFLADLFLEYFISCTPEPPAVSKVRELLNLLRRTRFQVPAHGHAPG